MRRSTRPGNQSAPISQDTIELKREAYGAFRETCAELAQGALKMFRHEAHRTLETFRHDPQAQKKLLAIWQNAKKHPHESIARMVEELCPYLFQDPSLAVETAYFLDGNNPRVAEILSVLFSTLNHHQLVRILERVDLLPTHFPFSPACRAETAALTVLLHQEGNSFAGKTFSTLWKIDPYAHEARIVAWAAVVQAEAEAYAADLVRKIHSHIKNIQFSVERLQEMASSLTGSAALERHPDWHELLRIPALGPLVASIENLKKIHAIEQESALQFSSICTLLKELNAAAAASKVTLSDDSPYAAETQQLATILEVEQEPKKRNRKKRKNKPASSHATTQPSIAADAPDNEINALSEAMSVVALVDQSPVMPQIALPVEAAINAEKPAGDQAQSEALPKAEQAQSEEQTEQKSRPKTLTTKKPIWKDTKKSRQKWGLSKITLHRKNLPEERDTTHIDTANQAIAAVDTVAALEPVKVTQADAIAQVVEAVQEAARAQIAIMQAAAAIGRPPLMWQAPYSQRPMMRRGPPMQPQQPPYMHYGQPAFQPFPDPRLMNSQPMGVPSYGQPVFQPFPYPTQQMMGPPPLLVRPVHHRPMHHRPMMPMPMPGQGMPMPPFGFMPRPF